MSLPFRGSCQRKNTHSAHEPAISTSVVISSEATNRHFLSPFLRHLSLNNANPARRCYGRSPRGRPPAARGRCPFPGRRLAPPGQGRQRGPGCRARSARRDAAGEAPPIRPRGAAGTCLPFPQEALGLGGPGGLMLPELLLHVAVPQRPQRGRQRPVQQQDPPVQAPRTARHGGGA